MKRMGPDLKMPDLKSIKGFKPPAALADVYYDLRDRRLLPLVALVVVAIVAVPFLLGGDAESPESAPPPATGAVLEGDSPGATSLTVVEAAPGLRDYRKRLRGRTPTDPFKQRYTSVPEAAQLESSLSSSPSPEAGLPVTEEKVTVDGGSTTIEVEPGGSGKPRGGDGSGGSGGPPDSVSKGSDDAGVRLIEFRIDIQVSRTEVAGDGSQRWTTPQLRRQVAALTQLPGRRATVATVGGVNLRNGKVFFLVSDDVDSLDGDFACKTRTAGNLCELLELEEGTPLELVYGPSDVRYRIKVIGVDAVWADETGAGRRSLSAGLGGPTADLLPRP
jgi:hypothetical protein